MKAEGVRGTSPITHIRVEIPRCDAEALIAYQDAPHDACCGKVSRDLRAASAYSDLVRALRIVLGC